METSVRIGVLGCAEFAWRRMLPAFTADQRVRLVAVASRDVAKAERFATRFDCAAVTGYDELLARDDVDAVYVPLPAGLHAEWVERALLAGRHVLAEKPLTTDRAETARLLDLARARGLLLVENVLFVHHPQHATVRKLIADGAIGEPRIFTADFAIPPKPADDIRYRPDLGGGALLDVGVYPLRAAQHVVGDDLEVVGALLRDDTTRDVDVSGTALLTTPGGLTARLSFGMEHAYRASYEVWGSTGRITVDRAFTPPASWQPTLRLEWQDRREELTLPAHDQVGAAVAAFVDAVLDGPDPASPAAVSTRRLAELIGGVRDVARRVAV